MSNKANSPDRSGSPKSPDINRIFRLIGGSEKLNNEERKWRLIDTLKRMHNKEQDRNPNNNVTVEPLDSKDGRLYEAFKRAALRKVDMLT